MKYSVGEKIIITNFGPSGQWYYSLKGHQERVGYVTVSESHGMSCYSFVNNGSVWGNIEENSKPYYLLQKPKQFKLR